MMTGHSEDRPEANRAWSTQNNSDISPRGQWLQECCNGILDLESRKPGLEVI